MKRAEIFIRQGDLLDRETESPLGLEGGEGVRYVLITHDCDLLHTSERFVELIRGRTLTGKETEKTEFREARNPRKLHLRYGGGERCLDVELSHNERIRLDRDTFLAQAKKDPDLELSRTEKRALRQWLAARYGRPAFPNAFESRLREKVRRKTVDRLIGEILAPVSRFIVAVFFDLGEERFSELPDGTPYDLSIFLVYAAEEGGSEARESAEEAGRSLEALFRGVYGNPSEATGIRVDRIRAVSDLDFSLAQIVRMDQWRLESLSLGEEPEALLPSGHL